MKPICKILLLLLLAAAGCSRPTGEAAMSELVRSESGGFSFRPLAGYTVMEKAGTAAMFLPDGDQQSGPGLWMAVVPLPQAVSVEQAAAVLVKSTPAYAFSPPQPITLDTRQGLSMEFTSTYHAPDGILLPQPGAAEGELLQGRMMVVLLNPTRRFTCVMLAPAAKWQSLGPQLEAAAASLKFFEPAP